MKLLITLVITFCNMKDESREKMNDDNNTSKKIK
jgi:hypothetical protein